MDPDIEPASQRGLACHRHRSPLVHAAALAVESAPKFRWRLKHSSFSSVPSAATHVSVSWSQGVAAWEADGTLDGPLQPELGSCFDAIEKYLDIDLEREWNPDDKAMQVANAVKRNGQWDVSEAAYVRSPEALQPKNFNREDIFLQLLETAVRR